MKKLLFAATLVLLCAGTRVSAQESPDWTGDLSPISAAEWDRDKARHLLARAGFGGTPAEIDALAKLSPQAAVRRLVYFEGAPAAELPAFDHSGIFDEGLDPFPPSRPATTARAEQNGEALGIKVILFLVILAGLLYAAKRKVWADIH